MKSRAVIRFAVLLIAALSVFATVPLAYAQDAAPPANPVLTPEFSAFVQQILLLTLPPLAIAAVGYVIQALGGLWLKFKASRPDVAYVIESAAAMGVKVAEQTGLKNQWQNAGQAKYDLAFETAANWLKLQGVSVDGKLLGAAIEAAVIDQFPKDGPRGLTLVTK